MDMLAKKAFKNFIIKLDRDRTKEVCGGINTALIRCKLTRFILYLLLVLSAGCATTQHAADEALLDFLKNGNITKEIVLLKLGQPSATYEKEHIITYRIGHEKGRGYFLWDRDFNYSETEYQYLGWSVAKFSLVLIFDNENVLRKHSLVEVR